LANGAFDNGAFDNGALANGALANGAFDKESRPRAFKCPSAVQPFSKPISHSAQSGLVAPERCAVGVDFSNRN
jgi:hypothetical protein